MKSSVTDLGSDLFRISTFLSEYGMQLNQYLLADDEPFLMHAGFRGSFASAREAVASVIDPARLRWVGFSHFESDECGSLNDWLALAPGAAPLCGAVGKMVSVDDFATRPARALADDEVLATGRRRLRFLATPQVPHGWDAGMFFEETGRALLCSDLLFQPGDPVQTTHDDVLGAVREAITMNLDGPFAKDMPYTSYTDATLRRLAALGPGTLATMHGSTFIGDGAAMLHRFADTVAELLGRPPSVGSNRAVVERYVELFNRGDFEALRDVFAPDALIHGVLGWGRFDDVLPIWRELHDAFDVALAVADVACDGDVVVVRYDERGTFRRPFRGAEPTGRSYQLLAMEWFVVRQGRIERRWGTRDAASQARQLGIAAA